MGRQPFLDRLILGRSAYQDEPIQSSNNDRSETSEEESQNGTWVRESSLSNARYVQQYDSKGRPKNPETNALNSSLRHASNEVLELVGVVERKNSADTRVQLSEVCHIDRELVLINEEGRGQEWAALLDILSWLALWWPTALVRKIQVGSYSSTLPFAEIIRREVSTLLGSGWRGLLLGLMPGASISVLHKLLWHVLALMAEESASRLQNKVIASGLSRRKKSQLIRSLTVLVDVFLASVDIIFLPLEMYSIARQLSLAPPTPWRPLLTTQLPSFFRTTYNATFSSPAAFLLSPAPYLIAYSFLTRDASPEAPAFSDLTSHRLPPISEPINTTTRPTKSAYSDPFASILTQISNIRKPILRSLGWDMLESQTPGDAAGYETDMRYHQNQSPEDPDREIRVARHRSTTLARLPATWLGMRIDLFFVRILLLPLESLVMRKAALFYFLQSGMPLASGSSSAEPAAGVANGAPSSSVSGILLAGRTSDVNWSALAGRASQLGLSVALSMGAEAVMFGCVYAVVRKQGIAGYAWGNKRVLEISDEGPVKEEPKVFLAD